MAAGSRPRRMARKTASAAFRGRGSMNRLEGVTAQALSDTIGAIYDCALDPQRWSDAIRQMVDLCESAAGGMCVHDLRNAQNDFLFELGYPAEWPEQFQKHYPQSPLAAASIVGNVGDVHTLAEVCTDEELFGSRFYRELLKPFGYLRLYRTPGLEDGQARCNGACQPDGTDAKLRRIASSISSSSCLRTSAAHSRSPTHSISGR